MEKVEHFSFPVEVINVYEEVARRFWRQHEQIFTEQTAIHVLIAGYDSFGKQMALEADRLYHQRGNKDPFTITVLDQFPEYTRSGHIEKIPFDIEKESLKTLIEKNQVKFTHIFICFDEDYIDLMEGIELSEVFSHTPIYMNFTDERIGQTFTIATTKTQKSLYSAGTIQDVLTKTYLNL